MQALLLVVATFIVASCASSCDYEDVKNMYCNGMHNVLRIKFNSPVVNGVNVATLVDQVNGPNQYTSNTVNVKFDLNNGNSNCPPSSFQTNLDYLAFGWYYATDGIDVWDCSMIPLSCAEYVVTDWGNNINSPCSSGGGGFVFK